MEPECQDIPLSTLRRFSAGTQSGDELFLFLCPSNEANPRHSTRNAFKIRQKLGNEVSKWKQSILTVFFPRIPLPMCGVQSENYIVLII